jgi:hypothetical protein
VADVHAVKVGLTPAQVRQLGLPPNTNVKTTSSRFRKFSGRYGRAVYELEAVPARTLQGWLTDAIHAVIDVDAFNAQVEQEKQDARTLAAVRETARQALKGLAVRGT